MTSIELNEYILDLQMRMSYQYDDKILEYSRYGNFHPAIEYKNKALIQNQLLKALWRFDLETLESCSCLDEDQICRIISFLDKQIYKPRLAPDMPVTTTFKNESFSLCFNIKSFNCEKPCFSDYDDIRITLYTFSETVATYLDSEEEIKHLNGENISINVENTSELSGNQTLYVKVEVLENNDWEVLTEDIVITVLKDDLGLVCNWINNDTVIPQDNDSNNPEENFILLEDNNNILLEDGNNLTL